MSSSEKGDAEKARYWQRTISEAARSGTPIRAFCRQRQLRESQFYWWRHKLRATRISAGRRNWTFLGSDNGGRTAAVLTSLIATCKRHRIDPFVYLRDIFTRISAYPRNRLSDLLPDQWGAPRRRPLSPDLT